MTVKDLMSARIVLRFTLKGFRVEMYWVHYIATIYVRKRVLIMFDAIIADCDNKNLNELKHIIGCSELGFKVKAELNDGLKVLEYITSNKVDLIIMEIDIPKLNGVDLLKKVKCKNLCPCIIGLSHQENFYYARQGIIYGAFDYVLKPIQKQEIIKTLKRAAKYLERKNAEEKRNKELINKYVCNELNTFDENQYYLNHPNNIIRKACEYVTLYSNLNITLKSISEQFYISPNYFSFLFKDQTGESFQNYLVRVKIEKAKLLLAETNYKAYEISHILGYSEPAYFSRLFRKITGNNPTVYRKNYEQMKMQ